MTKCLGLIGLDPHKRGGVFGADPGIDHNPSLIGLITPSAGLQADFITRWHPEKMIRGASLNEHAQAARFEDVEGRSRNGQQFVERRIANSEMRVKDAGHMRGGTQPIVLRNPGAPAAQNMAVGAFNELLFGL